METMFKNQLVLVTTENSPAKMPGRIMQLRFSEEGGQLSGYDVEMFTGDVAYNLAPARLEPFGAKDLEVMRQELDALNKKLAQAHSRIADLDIKNNTLAKMGASALLELLQDADVKDALRDLIGDHVESMNLDRDIERKIDDAIDDMGIERLVEREVEDQLDSATGLVTEDNFESRLREAMSGLSFSISVE